MSPESYKLQTIAKFAPELFIYWEKILSWRNSFGGLDRQVYSTEMLEVMWRVEEKAFSSVDNLHDRQNYISELMKEVKVTPDMQGRWSFIQDYILAHATWQQRLDVFCKVIGKRQ